jgi:hypothetical protein
MTQAHVSIQPLQKALTAKSGKKDPPRSQRKSIPVCQGLLASFLAAWRLFFANFAVKSFLLKQNPIMKAIPLFRE